MTRKSVPSKKVHWDRIATYVGTTIAIIGFCFSYPSVHEIFAYPTLWSLPENSNTTNTATTVSIRQSGSEIQEKGELSFLLLDVPYTADFKCQLHPKDGLWKGTCLYNFKSAGTKANFSCSVTTIEWITSFTRKSIEGYSQALDNPDKPDHCPTPRNVPAGHPTEHFVLQPAPDKS